MRSEVRAEVQAGERLSEATSADRGGAAVCRQTA